jgi:hypothetical protein
MWGSKSAPACDQSMLAERFGPIKRTSSQDEIRLVESRTTKMSSFSNEERSRAILLVKSDELASTTQFIAAFDQH